MSDWLFAVHAPDGIDAAALATFEDDEIGRGTTVRHVTHGAASNNILVVDALNAKAQHIVRGACIKVYRTALSTTVPQTFFFIDKIETKVVSEREDYKVLAASGTGTLWHLANAVLLDEPYTTAPIPRPDLRGGLEVDGLWVWGADENGQRMGAICRRVYEEGRDQPSSVGDSPFYAVDADFNRTVDSAGVAWPAEGERYEKPIGTSVLEVFQDAVASGLYAQMTGKSSGRLNLSVYQSMGEDRSGSVFGSGAVRFVNLPNDTDNNIATDLTRQENDRQVSDLLVAGDEFVYERAGDAGANMPRWETISFPSNDPSLLQLVAERNLHARNLAIDAIRFPLARVGDDDANGVYYISPEAIGGHAWMNDTVTVHTGATSRDLSETDFPLAAWELRMEDDWEEWVEVGHVMVDAQRRAFEQSVTSIRHTLELCRPGTISESVEASCSLPSSSMNAIDTPNGGFETGGTTHWTFDHTTGGVVGPTSGDHEGDFYYQLNGAGWAQYKPFSAGFTFLAGQTYVARVRISGPAHELRLGKDPLTSTEDVGIVSLTEPHGGGWFEACVEWTPTANRAGNEVAVVVARTTGLANFLVDDVRVYTGGTVRTPRDGHPDLVGTSIRATRCDHRHDVHRDSAPTVNDDEARGYKLGTIWAQIDSLTAPTEIVGVWMLVDASEGSAVWAEWPGGGGGSHELDDLTDVDLTGASDGDFLKRDGGIWVPDTFAGLSNPMTTAGDIIKGGSGGTPERLGIGSTGQVLKVVSGAPAWAAESGGGGGSGAPELPLDALARSSVGSGDHFGGTSLDGGWSSLQSTALDTVDASVDDFLILGNNNAQGTGVQRGVKRSFSPAGDFIVWAKVIRSRHSLNWQGYVLFVGATNPSDGSGGERIEIRWYQNNDQLKFDWRKRSSGGVTGVADENSPHTVEALQLFRGVGGNIYPMWIAMRRVGSNISVGASQDGVEWAWYATTTTISFTVATCGLALMHESTNNDSRVIFDYIATT